MFLNTNRIFIDKNSFIIIPMYPLKCSKPKTITQIYHCKNSIEQLVVQKKGKKGDYYAGQILKKRDIKLKDNPVKYGTLSHRV